MSSAMKAHSFRSVATLSFQEGLRTRHFSSSGTGKEQRYIDKWFESIVKSEDFYSLQSSGSIRRYFYNIDLQGRLFLEETLPKNIATSIKDEKFLNFFFSRVQTPRGVDKEFLQSEGILQDYPFVSLCGREVNFIRPAATPIVFHSLMGTDLYFAGSLKQDFKPSDLAISLKTGRLFHKIAGGKTKLEPAKDEMEYGLIRSSAAVNLSESIQHDDDDNGSGFYFATESGTLPIQSLPASAEAGDWALPWSSEKD